MDQSPQLIPAPKTPVYLLLWPLDPPDWKLLAENQVTLYEAVVGCLLHCGPSLPHSAQASPEHTPLHLSDPSFTIYLLDCSSPPNNSFWGLISPTHKGRGPPDLHQTLLKKRAEA